MGKYINSDIHNRYSDWHWNLIEIDKKYKRLYCADIDRFWIEYDFYKKAVIAVQDLKYEGTNDGITATEKGIYDWFISKDVPCYIIFITRDFEKFRVVSYKNETEIKFDGIGYADWLLSLRGDPYNFPGTSIQNRLSTEF